MNGAKEAILNRVRAAGSTVFPFEAIPREYRQSAPADLARLEERLVDYGVRVYHSMLETVRETIAAAAGQRRLLVPPGFPAEWKPFEAITDNGLSYLELDRSDGVLTTCAAAIVETGTIVLRHSDAEGRRALTLIPDYHLCVVRAEQVVATVPEAIRLASEFGRAPLTTISGPSATSDIEMTRVKGVHGPRTLEVLLVS